jgi:glycogen debranching enzyme
MPNELLLRVFPDLLFAHHGRSLLVTDRGGAIGDGLQGLYERDLRILSRYELLVHGQPPRLDALSSVDSYSTLGYYVCPPRADAADPLDALGLSTQELDRQVLIRVARFVGQGLHEDVDVTNYGLTDAELELAWNVATDFADLMEARSGRRRQEAPLLTRWEVTADGQGELRIDYQHPRLPRGVIVRFRSAGLAPERQGERVSYQFTLGPQESRHLCLEVVPVVEGSPRAPYFGCDAFGVLSGAAGRVGHTWTHRATRLQVRNAVVQHAWDRAIADLEALALGDGMTAEELTVPAAGIPLYGTLFGRDALTTAGQSLLASPVLAEGALRLLARYLGNKDDDFHDEQPGRVPQQVRDGPLALLGLTPWLRDYGDYAAPLAFLVLIGGHHVAVGNAELTREFLDPALRVLAWLDRRADLDGDGFLEYLSRSPHGQRHQGWKDSGDGVVYADGTQVEPPVAASEIQGYWYSAKLSMAEVFLSLGDTARAVELFHEATALKQRFNQSFWMPEERFIAFALDSQKRQVTSIASNAAHCLATGIVDRSHAEQVVRRLMAPDMFSGWGIRTLSSANPAYNPFKYHLGSVWPVENATAAFGMKRYGFGEECNAVAKGIFDAAAIFERYRLPEVFGGLPRDHRHPHPGIYPDACAPQAWSASAVIWLIQAMLGLWSYAPLNALIVEPELPDWIPELTIRDLRVKRARVSIQFKRQAGGKTDYRVLKREGTIHVLRQPPPEDLTAGPTTRLRELVESLLPGH